MSKLQITRLFEAGGRDGLGPPIWLERSRERREGKEKEGYSAISLSATLCCSWFRTNFKILPCSIVYVFRLKTQLL